MEWPKIRDDLARLEGYHSPQVDVQVKLNTNESPIPPPQQWVDDLGKELRRVEWNRYPDRSTTKIRSDIAAFHNIDPNMVFVANGSNEVLQSLLLAYGGLGRKAAVFEPTYALHSHISMITGTEVVIGERKEDFTIDMENVSKVLDQQPNVLFLCSPNNPTGTIVTSDFVKDVASRCSQMGTLVVVDEAYGEFSDWSATDLIGEGLPIVITKTFSKTWSMAGMRLGYMIAPPEIVDATMSVALPYHLDMLKQIAGSLALRHVGEMKSRVELLVQERNRLEERLRALPIQQWPSGANFILFRPDKNTRITGEMLWHALLEKSVLVRNCATWPRLEGCLRVTIGTPEENNSFIDSLEVILE
ncbi:MAG: histidinol-phosphate transaminase [Acidimicrobiales bacterium]|nr:histidinol-phosphate transaminase [Acidimicrobiales bacterium]